MHAIRAGVKGAHSDQTKRAYDPSPASGNLTLVMLVVMLVERVFFVSGVVKTVFAPNKKK